MASIWAMSSAINFGIRLCGESDGDCGIGLVEAGEIRFRLLVSGHLLGHLAAGNEDVREIGVGSLLAGIDGQAELHVIDFIDEPRHFSHLRFGHFLPLRKLLVRLFILFFSPCCTPACIACRANWRYISGTFRTLMWAARS